MVAAMAATIVLVAAPVETKAAPTVPVEDQETTVPVEDQAIMVLVDLIMVALTTAGHVPTMTAIAGTAACDLVDRATAGTITTATTAGAGSRQSHPLIALGVRL